MKSNQDVEGEKTALVDQPKESHTPLAYVLSCVTFWACCNWIFGGLAFYFALTGDREKKEGHAEQGKKSTKVSIWISAVGILISLIVLALVLGLCLGLGRCRGGGGGGGGSEVTCHCASIDQCCCDKPGGLSCCVSGVNITCSDCTGLLNATSPIQASKFISCVHP